MSAYSPTSQSHALDRPHKDGPSNHTDPPLTTEGRETDGDSYATAPRSTYARWEATDGSRSRPPFQTRSRFGVDAVRPTFRHPSLHTIHSFSFPNPSLAICPKPSRIRGRFRRTHRNPRVLGSRSGFLFLPIRVVPRLSLRFPAFSMG